MIKLRLACLGILAVIILSAPPFGANGYAQKRKGEKGERKGGQKHIFSGPAPSHPFDIILGRPTDKSITISVMTNKDGTAQIAYGHSPGKLDRSSAEQPLKKGEPFEFHLGELTPDTRYFYRLKIRDGASGEFKSDEQRTFHTQRKPGSSFVFTVQADSHLDQATRPAVYDRTLANVLADKPDFHVDLGDTFMTDKYDKHTDALPQYIAQRYYFGKAAHSVPLFLVLGNHDGERLDRYDGTETCMSVWSCRTRKLYFPNPYPDGFYTGNQAKKNHVDRLEDYYAWEWGDALFVGLNQFWTTTKPRRNNADGNWARTLGKDQYDWLAKTLAQSKAKYKFIFTHHLVGGLDDQGRGGSEAAVLYEWGGKGKDGKDAFKEKRPGWAMPIHELLKKHHGSVVFHGHDHFFAKQDLDGMVYLMVPQPGDPGSDRLRNVDEYGYIRGDFMPPSGHIRVSISPEQAKVEYVRSYLPQAESEKRKNGQVGYSFMLKP
ncbi:MAG: metallophosphoesterase [Gemmataceae bacterium]